jgi:hypothetical protein
VASFATRSSSRRFSHGQSGRRLRQSSRSRSRASVQPNPSSRHATAKEQPPSCAGTASMALLLAFVTTSAAPLLTYASSASSELGGLLSFARTTADGEVAPIPDLPVLAPERGGSTHNGPSFLIGRPRTAADNGEPIFAEYWRQQGRTRLPPDQRTISVVGCGLLRVCAGPGRRRTPLRCGPVPPGSSRGTGTVAELACQAGPIV